MKCELSKAFSGKQMLLVRVRPRLWPFPEFNKWKTLMHAGSQLQILISALGEKLRGTLDQALTLILIHA